MTKKRYIDDGGGLGRLEALFARTTSTDRVEGALAYGRYHRVLKAFAGYYGFGIVPTVEAFAATSPNNDYHGNLRSMASVLHAVNQGLGPRDFTVSCYKACAERAYGYATGETSFLDTVKGEKITVFRHNLLYPETSKRATVDGHMFAAWAGDYTMTMKQAALTFSGSKKWYIAVERDIVRLAKKHGLLPHQMQAILWIARKRIQDNKYSTQMHMDHGKQDLSRILCRPEDYLPYPTRQAPPTVLGKDTARHSSQCGTARGDAGPLNPPSLWGPARYHNEEPL
jgi:hypothetical protein